MLPSVFEYIFRQFSGKAVAGLSMRGSPSASPHFREAVMETKPLTAAWSSPVAPTILPTKRCAVQHDEAATPHARALRATRLVILKTVVFFTQ